MPNLQIKIFKYETNYNSHHKSTENNQFKRLQQKRIIINSSILIESIKLIAEKEKKKQKDCKLKQQMMNVKNFYLKSGFMSFNSETLYSQHSKQVAKGPNQKNNRVFVKNSERVQRVDMLMKNFKLASKTTPTKENISKIEVPPAHFEFQPPSLQSRRNKTLNNISSTLTPRKSTQYPSSYQLYKTDYKEYTHNRRLSDISFLKNKNHKSLFKVKEIMANPQTNKLVKIDFQIPQAFVQPHINYKSPKVQAIGKSSNKIKLFEINNYFNQNQQVTHTSKNSSFITTLPTKKRTFLTAKSGRLNSNKTKQNLSQNKKQQIPQAICGMSSSIQQKYDDIKKSIQTKGSTPTQKIGLKRAEVKPVSKDSFPQTPYWQKDEEFNKHSQAKQRIYRVKQKESSSKTKIKQKDNLCRPWSSEKQQKNQIHFEDQLQFLCIKEDSNVDN